MSAATTNITIEQGVPFTMILNTNITLTGYEVKAQIRSHRGSWKLVKDFSCAITGATQITISLTSVETARIRAYSLPYKYDIFLYANGSNSIKLLEGDVLVKGRVTRR